MGNTTSNAAPKEAALADERIRHDAELAAQRRAWLQEKESLVTEKKQLMQGGVAVLGTAALVGVGLVALLRQRHSLAIDALRIAATKAQAQALSLERISRYAAESPSYWRAQGSSSEAAKAKAATQTQENRARLAESAAYSVRLNPESREYYESRGFSSKEAKGAAAAKRAENRGRTLANPQPAVDPAFDGTAAKASVAGAAAPTVASEAAQAKAATQTQENRARLAESDAHSLRLNPETPEYYETRGFSSKEAKGAAEAKRAENYGRTLANPQPAVDPAFDGTAAKASVAGAAAPTVASEAAQAKAATETHANLARMVLLRSNRLYSNRLNPEMREYYESRGFSSEKEKEAAEAKQAENRGRIQANPQPAVDPAFDGTAAKASVAGAAAPTVPAPGLPPAPAPAFASAAGAPVALSPALRTTRAKTNGFSTEKAQATITTQRPRGLSTENADEMAAGAKTIKRSNITAAEHKAKSFRSNPTRREYYEALGFSSEKADILAAIKRTESIARS